MDDDFRGYDLYKELMSQDNDFARTIQENLNNGKIRFFDDREWDKIKQQNYVPPIPTIEDFYDMFCQGYNIGNCVGASRQLSFSYDDVDIVTGTLPAIRGTRNAEKEGGHGWLETYKEIIDTSLLLVIDKSLKEQLGYQEEYRLTQRQLRSMPRYIARKEYVNDPYLRNDNKSSKK